MDQTTRRQQQKITLIKMISAWGQATTYLIKNKTRKICGNPGNYTPRNQQIRTKQKETSENIQRQNNNPRKTTWPEYGENHRDQIYGTREKCNKLTATPTEKEKQTQREISTARKNKHPRQDME